MPTYTHTVYAKAEIGKAVVKYVEESDVSISQFYQEAAREKLEDENAL